MKGKENDSAVLNEDRQSEDEGFSLMELIVGVVIIGIIAAIAIPIFLNTQDNARQSAVEATAASALTPVQESVMSGITAFGSSLEGLAGNDEVELSVLEDNIVAGDPDSVCVQASWVGADNIATAGVNCEVTDDSLPGEEDEEGVPSVTGDVELVWDVSEDRSGPLSVTLDESETGLNIVIPIQGNVSATIDWGDGSVEEVTEDNPVHSYEVADTYEIRIEDATFDSWVALDVESSQITSDLSGLRRVEEWGETGTTDLTAAFVFAWDLEWIENIPSTTTQMSMMMAHTPSFNGDISGWSTSNATDMSRMFEGATEFNQPIESWDVSNVENMSNMFNTAYSFNQPLNGWDVGEVKNMEGMFYAAESFNQPLDNWDTSRVLSMEEMFSSHLNTDNIFNQPIGSWDTSRVMNMRHMFRYNEVFDQDLSGWDVRNVKNMQRMFADATSFNGNISDWDTSSVENMSYMFWKSTSFNQNLSDWDVSNVSQMQYMFNDASSFNNGEERGRSGQPLAWEISPSNQNMIRLFSGASSFNQDISSWDVSQVRNMTSMFVSAESFNQDIGGWDVSNVTLMMSMFYGAEIFNQDLSGWDASNVNDVFSINRFGNGSALEDRHIPAAFR